MTAFSRDVLMFAAGVLFCIIVAFVAAGIMFRRDRREMERGAQEGRLAALDQQIRYLRDETRRLEVALAYFERALHNAGIEVPKPPPQWRKEGWVFPRPEFPDNAGGTPPA